MQKETNERIENAEKADVLYRTMPIELIANKKYHISCVSVSEMAHFCVCCATMLNRSVQNLIYI